MRKAALSLRLQIIYRLRVATVAKCNEPVIETIIKCRILSDKVGLNGRPVYTTVLLGLRQFPYTFLPSIRNAKKKTNISLKIKLNETICVAMSEVNF